MIAIVNSQYCGHAARATKLFYRGRFELVAEMSDFLRMLPRQRNIHSETIQQVAAMIKREVNEGQSATALGRKMLKKRCLRIQRETDANCWRCRPRWTRGATATSNNSWLMTLALRGRQPHLPHEVPGRS